MDISNMTLDEKIGQMIMAGFPSKYYDGHIKKLIEEYKVGNVDLFARNIGTVDEIGELMYEIQINMIKNNKVPAFIGVDQEGGMVTRVREKASFFPGNMAFGASQIKGSTQREGEITGEELRALGINLDLAPVLDVNNNPKNPVICTRSYGDNPGMVARLGVDFIKGLQSRGVVATAKHFPGHGDTAVDTHLGMPAIPYNMSRLEKVELYPFRKAIEAKVDAIMTAHIVFNAIGDDKLPATLSYNALTKLLRRDMGFEGLIITDCMEMNAIMKNFGIEKGSVMAVNAGADMLCISHHLDVQVDSIKAIKKAVKDGEISIERINESVGRILNMKEKYDLFNHPYPDLARAKELLSSKETIDFAQMVSEKSITLIRNEKNLLPVKSGNIISISTEPIILTGAEDCAKEHYSFCEAIKKAFGGRSVVIPINPDEELIDNIAKDCAGADRIIIGTYNASLNPGQVKLMNRIHEVNDNIIAIAMRSPYDIMFYESVPACICAYEYTPLSIRSIIKILKGETKATGSLPVHIP